MRYSHDTVLTIVEAALWIDAPIHPERVARELVIEYSTDKQFALIEEMGL